MSEKILKALMQLFAIIANPGSNLEEKRHVVESFLRRQINEDLIKGYIKTFETYYVKYQKRQLAKGDRVIPLSSVRVLKICTEINEELTQPQKVIVLVQLLEFVKTDSTRGEITEQEMEFIATVADTFFIDKKSYQRILSFVHNSFDNIDDSEHLLVIDKEVHQEDMQTKFLKIPHLEGQIRILHIPSVSMYLLRYIGESEMYMNSQLLQNDKVYVFRTGSSIRNRNIKPIYYSSIVGYFNEDRFKSKVVFKADSLFYKFPDGKYGINDISFTEENGRLVGIMGASGSGKSTLLNVLNGTNSPSKGSISINNFNIHTQKEQVDGLIGHVPQDDLLIEELSVYQNLYYNAKLCFDNYSEEEVEAEVSDMLKSLGLFEIKDIQVGNPLNQKISGGQRKRLNIALELIREPSVLFLDEPTSGLSSRDSENILDLLKELALKGKLVFVVIHQPSSDIFKMFDKLIILDTGGYLIYNGDPIDSIVYFKSRVHHANWSESECPLCGNVNPEQIFNIIEANVVDEYGNLTTDRKITPREWVKFYEQYNAQDQKAANDVPEDVPDIDFKTPNRLNQWLIFLKRDILSKLTNTQYIVINLLEAPLLAFLLSFIVKYWDVSAEGTYTLFDNDNLPVYILMSVICAIFIGLTVSAEEIIKDRKILKREAFLNLSWFSYLMAKISNQLMISAFQALMFVVVGNTIMEIRGMYFEYWLVLFSAWAAANLLGLVISDSFKTVVTIYIIIPFLVIPQLILSGIMVRYEKLNPLVSSPTSIPIYGEVIHARWAYEALAVYTYKHNDFQKLFYPYEKEMSIAGFKKNYWLPALQNKLNSYERNQGDSEQQENLYNSVALLRNEIEKENHSNPLVHFDQLDGLVPGEPLDEQLISDLHDYFTRLNRYFVLVFNRNNEEKDKIVSEMQQTAHGREKFFALRSKYYNNKLADFMTNANDLQRIIEYDNRLYQKIDPIYLDPLHPFIKAHFYAPRKAVFGVYMDTYWVNVMMLWFITFFTFMVLYFRLLKRSFDFFEKLSGRLQTMKENKKQKKESDLAMSEVALNNNL